jgi:hypothetical protein
MLRDGKAGWEKRQLNAEVVYRRIHAGSPAEIPANNIRVVDRQKDGVAITRTWLPTVHHWGSN